MLNEQLQKIDPSTTLVFLIGVKKYDHKLEPLPAAENNVLALEKIFREKVGIENIESITDKATTPISVINIISNAINITETRIKTEDPKKDISLIIFYYAGHGLLNFDKTEYYLSLSETINDRDTKLRMSAINVRDLFATFKRSVNANVLMIIDSCYSKNVFNGVTFDNKICIFTATKNFEKALYPEGSPFSVFTGVLIEILLNGIANATAELCFNDVMGETRLRLINQQKPEPELLTNGFIDNISFIKNQHNNQVQVYPVFAIDNALNGIFTAMFPGVTNRDKMKKRITQNFPTIISVYLRNIISDSQKLNSRYDLLEFYSQIIRFLAFIIIKDLTDRNNVLPNDRDLFNSWIKPKIISEHFYIEILRRACGTDNYKQRMFVSELYEKRNFLNTINRIEGLFDAERNLQDFVIFRSELFRLLANLSFLKNYELLAIRIVTAKKSFFNKLVFRHEVSHLRGEDASPYSYKFTTDNDDELISEGESLNNGIILVRRFNLIDANDIIRRKKFINLWPFIIDGSEMDNLDDDQGAIKNEDGTDLIKKTRTTDNKNSIPTIYTFHDIIINDKNDQDIQIIYKPSAYINDRKNYAEYGDICFYPDRNEWIRFIAELNIPLKQQPFTADLKFRVVFEALKESTDLENLSIQYGVHRDKISDWKSDFVVNAPSMFSDDTP